MPDASASSALLTDLYQLTMAAGYYDAGKAHDRATFEMSVRRLPPQRNFILAAGLAQAVDYLLNLRFTAEQIAYIRGLPKDARATARDLAAIIIANLASFGCGELLIRYEVL